MSRRASALVTLALLLSGSAHAWPVDWSHDVELGKEKFVKLPGLDWFEVEDPKVAAVEWMADSNELIITGLKAGKTHVLLGAEGKVAAWRVRVGQKPVLDEKVTAAAQKACPDFKATPAEDTKLFVGVRDEKCRQALIALFQTDAYEARHLELEFEGKVLQAQLKGLQEGIERVAKGHVTARYVGAGVILDGKPTPEEHRRVLWEILRRTIGRYALDDRTEVEEPPDAGR